MNKMRNYTILYYYSSQADKIIFLSCLITIFKCLIIIFEHYKINYLNFLLNFSFNTINFYVFIFKYLIVL